MFVFSFLFEWCCSWCGKIDIEENDSHSNSESIRKLCPWHVLLRICIFEITMWFKGIHFGFVITMMPKYANIIVRMRSCKCMCVDVCMLCLVLNTNNTNDNCSFTIIFPTFANIAVSPREPIYNEEEQYVDKYTHAPIHIQNSWNLSIIFGTMALLMW